MMRGVSKRIGSIKFACLSPDEIRKMSATKIITADTYDDDGFPIEMGLMDPRLGVIDPGLVAPVVLGILLGAYLGTKVLVRLTNKAVRWFFMVVLLVLGVQMLVRGVLGAL